MQSNMEDIAIIGFACKLPQDITDSQSYWKTIEEGKNVMTDWPESRMRLDAFYSADPRIQDSLKAKGGHFLSEDPAIFDAPFFSITAKEAAAMDPQQRIILETSYLALENAGIPLSRVSGSQTAVFEASMADDYNRIILQDPEDIPRTTATGTANAILANRVSWFFNLLGPSLHIDTACSGSMVATDLACNSLRNGDSTMALVAGSNLMLSPEASLMLSRMNFLSPDSLCYSFDSRANGYARGEGTIVMVLKSIANAIQDGDTIRAVIRSTGVNQDGHTPGITQPSANSQELLIRSVYEKAGLELSSTRYVEAHGTGTPIGDPLEMKAIGRVFRSSRSPAEPLYVGSVKANIGHLEGGSGLAGILKSILILERGLIPPNANFEEENPELDTEFYNTKIPTKLTVWPSCGLRRISVNSFGFGGTNAHVVLDDAFHYLASKGLRGKHCTIATLPEPINRSGNGVSTIDSGYPLNQVLELQNPNSIQEVCSSHEIYQPEGELHTSNKLNKNETSNSAQKSTDSPEFNGVDESDSVDESSGIRKTNEIYQYNGTLIPVPDSHEFPSNNTHLLVFSASDENALERTTQQFFPYYREFILGNKLALERLAFTLSARRSNLLWRSYAIADPRDTNAEVDLQMSKPQRSATSTQRGIAFVFTGQGAEYARMGVELLKFSVFRKTLERVEQVFAGLGCRWSLLGKLQDLEFISRPKYNQPLCTALQIGLIELLKSLNIVPVAVVGHSSGEIAAAYCVGALSMESACKVAYYRGLLADKLIAAIATRGAMMSINLSCAEMPAYIDQTFHDWSEPPALHIACINSPTNVTVSGEEAAVNTLKEKLDGDGIFAHKLATGVAYHSPAMKAMSCDYVELMGELHSGVSQNPLITMISTVTGEPVVPKQLFDPHYWVRNLLSPVRFVDAMDCILKLDTKIQLGLPISRPVFDLIEVGPHSALRRPCRDIVGRSQRATEVRYTSVLDRNSSSIKAVLNLAGILASIGYPVLITDANNRGQLPEQGDFLVDIPQYPFDRSQRYWHETRMSYDYRMRGSVPRDVLGARSPDWNPLEPKWRKIIRTQELPWVADHVVSSNCIYPATGSLVMAIEAIRQTVPENRTVKAFFVKEATFSSPMIIRQDNDGEGEVECVINLRPIRKPYEKESRWFEIWISTHHQGTWTECFRTTIQVQYDETPGLVDAGKEHKLAHQAAVDTYGCAAKICQSSIPSNAFYKYCAEKGVTYGPSFRILEDIAWSDGGVAIGRVDVTRPAAQYQGLVHPAIIDAACQVCWLAPSKGLSEKMPTEVPRRLRNTYIAASGWRHPSISHVKISAKARFTEAGKGVEGSILVLGDDDSLLCSVQSLELSPVADDSPHGSLNRTLLHGIRYMPCLSMSKPSQLASICKVEQFAEDEAALTKFSERLTQTLLTKMQEILTQLSEHDRQTAAPHFNKYLTWMERVCTRYRETDPGPNFSLDDRLGSLDTSKPEWAVYTAVARNLISIIRGDVDPLDLIFSTNLAERYYANIFRSVCDERFSVLMDLVSHENPNLAILEVGAGTGSMTTQVISALVDLEQHYGGTRFAKYMYTDLSHAFFEDAMSKFQKTRNRMEFKALDLQLDIAEQGFEVGAYDVVVAGSVLHTTADLSATLRNVRKALKPGGKLIFFENTAPSVALQFGFGTLPGWWLGTESWRVGDQDQCTTEDQWHNLLVNTGFSGNDLVIRDTPSTTWHTFSIMVSTAQKTEVKELCPKPRILVCINDKSDLQLRLADSIRNGSLNTVDSSFEVFGLDKVSSLEIGPDDRVIALFEAEKSLLDSLTTSEFATLQIFMQKCQNLLWFMCADVHEKDFSFTGMTIGFLRTMRSEATSRRIITLALEGSCTNIEDCAANIAEVFESTFTHSSPEVEYIVRSGQILIPRLFEEKELNKNMLESVYPTLASESWGEGSPITFDVGTRGTLDSLQWIEDPVYSKDLGADEVEVEARAWGLNFRDVFLALGRMEDNGFGLDTAGYVTRVGLKCSSFRPGDRVLITICGSMRKFPRSHQLETIKIPDSMSFEDATSVIAPAMTAHHCLIDIARLQEGEKVLIHSAAGATGQLAIQIAQMIGAEIFVTVGNDEKKQLVTSFGIAQDHILDSRDTTFAHGIQRLTDGYGVDVVLNSLSGDGLRASWECIAPFGRFIEIGKADIKANSSLPMQCFADNTSFFAVDLAHIITVRKPTTRRLLDNTMDLFSKGKIRQPQPRHIYPVSAIESAFRFLQSGKNTGRIVINNAPSDIVPKLLTKKRGWRFQADASYLIAGGLGGIGRAISRWMMRKGVKNLILPSRSGPNSRAAIDLVEELTRNGVNVEAPVCDVSLIESVSDMIDSCAKTMPPIKGCMNAAMVLQDAILENMTYSQWETTIRSKVATSWILHELLPKELEFFVLLSSLAGVFGNVSQSNYAAGNTFQDTLARYRTSNGRKALSINLGWMRTIGIISEREEYQNFRMAGADMAKIEEDELMALLDIYCDPGEAILDPSRSQILIGTITPADLHAKGIKTPDVMGRPLFSSFSASTGATHISEDVEGADFSSLFKQSRTEEERVKVVVTALAAKLARSLSMSPDDIDHGKALFEYGVDSLVAVELRNWIGKKFAADVPVFDIMGGATIAAVGGLVSKKSTAKTA